MRPNTKSKIENKGIIFFIVSSIVLILAYSILALHKIIPHIIEPLFISANIEYVGTIFDRIDWIWVMIGFAPISGLIILTIISIMFIKNKMPKIRTTAQYKRRMNQYSRSK